MLHVMLRLTIHINVKKGDIIGISDESPHRLLAAVRVDETTIELIRFLLKGEMEIITIILRQRY